MSKKISVYVSYHDVCDLVKTKYFKPIQVGSDIKGVIYPNQLNDSIGDNISNKNASFCELTAQYWAWKNDLNSDYIGFYHYRRHLILNKENNKISNQHGVVVYDSINEGYLDDIGYADKYLDELLNDYNVDMIIPEKWNVRNDYAKNNYDQYKYGNNLFIEDYNKCIEIINKKHPDYGEYISYYNKSNYGYYTNMFIMKKELFSKYCEWLFDILFELEKTLDLENRNIQESRVFGYISEWLFGVYITKIKSENIYNIIERKRTFISNVNENKVKSINANDGFRFESIRPLNKKFINKKVVPIVTTFDNNYAITGSALIESIMYHSNEDVLYDIYIIDGNLPIETKIKLKIQISNYKNASLTIVDINNYFSGINLNLHSHFSKETLNRILIPDILKKYNKVVYLDADLIVNKDISELYDVDIKNKSIAAVKDYAMKGFVNFGTHSINTCGSLPAKKYLKDYLELSDYNNYFQAGVLIFNCEKIRKSNKLNLMLDDILKSKPYWFLDQDLLNKHFENDVFFLEDRWNVIHGNGDIETFFKKIPPSIIKPYFLSRTDPWIIHYAGERKPWLYPSVDFSDIFFFYSIKTPFYKTKIENKENSYINDKSKLNIKKIANRFLPYGSLRRKLVRYIYLKLKD
jgi:lipopolysaccharide biosynthesis glycosyltransferase